MNNEEIKIEKIASFLLEKITEILDEEKFQSENIVKDCTFNGGKQVVNVNLDMEAGHIISDIINAIKQQNTTMQQALSLMHAGGVEGPVGLKLEEKTTKNK